MHYDELFTYLGRRNRYLWSSFLLVSLAIMSEALHAMIQVFLLVETDHWCHLPGWEDVCNDSGLNSTECESQLAALRPPDDPDTLLIDENKCSQYNYTNFVIGSNTSQLYGTEHPCEQGWEFDNTQYKTTVNEDFELVCSSAQKVSIAMSSVFAGVIVTSAVLGTLSDKYGRKRLILVCFVCETLLDFAAAFSQSYWTFVTLRFLASLFYAGVFLPGYIYASEVVGPTERSLAPSIAGAFWATGYVITAVYAYFIRYWRKLLIFICLVDVFIFLVIFLLVPESPRWLHSIGRFDEAEAIIRKASEYGKEIPDEVYKELREEKVDEQTENSKASVKDLFRSKVICLRTIVITTLGFIINSVYFGVSLSAITLSSNDYLAVGLSAAVEIPACLLSRLAIDQWGRRTILGSALLMAGLSCIAIAFTSDWLIMVFGLIGKFCISSSYNIHFVFAAEMFPTPIRNVGIGFATMVGNCGAVLAPQLMYVGVVWKQLPYFIFGGFSVIGVLLILLLPETKNTNLPQSIQEGKTLGVNILSAAFGGTDSEAQCHDAPFDVMETQLTT